GDSWRGRGLRGEEPREVAEGAAGGGAPSGRGVAWSGARPTGSASRGGRGLAAQGSESTSHHQDVVDRAGDGTASDGTDGGHRDHPSPVSDPRTVLELLRAGDRDALVVGLGAEPDRDVDRRGGSTDAKGEPEEADGAEGGRPEAA